MGFKKNFYGGATPRFFFLLGDPFHPMPWGEMGHPKFFKKMRPTIQNNLNGLMIKQKKCTFISPLHNLEQKSDKIRNIAMDRSIQYRAQN